MERSDSSFLFTADPVQLAQAQGVLEECSFYKLAVLKDSGHADFQNCLTISAEARLPLFWLVLFKVSDLNESDLKACTEPGLESLTYDLMLPKDVAIQRLNNFLEAEVGLCGFDLSKALACFLQKLKESNGSHVFLDYSGLFAEAETKQQRTNQLLTCLRNFEVSKGTLDLKNLCSNTVGFVNLNSQLERLNTIRVSAMWAEDLVGAEVYCESEVPLEEAVALACTGGGLK